LDPTYTAVLWPLKKFLSKGSNDLLLAPLKLDTNFLKLSEVTLFKDPKAAILTLKMHTESRL
jgi:hypothetical protein